MSRADNERRDVFDERAIHLGAGFKEQERPHVLETWGPQNPPALNLNAPEQTLRTTLPGLPPLVAVADDRELTRALGEAKRELIRQIDHHKSAREAMNSRQLRSETIRHPKQLGESP